ncbi:MULTISPECIES: 3,4-dihydroxy-2-butanone-4-phosphate synthase [Glutamicibacter]|uniref:3,4-dihydroxy-2-butanone-4-phosphate synthase n=1 Tax=Glutamicibacter TaxID=1742989 RepID=UPI0015C551C0|nr:MULTISPECIES: 3,4-dihydroxy-2-butanone-4-phosphate synthase [Glutamicibacter]MBF6672351.1 3,4-dihydroxy-2-butanone-4-phosphate synthase [Glutamicibacter sp. FBE19]NQD40709.1 3,4-dihydroxy-2-butanone-4-phosphate synthase [Glutamicibacter halophytocola]
MGSSTLDPIPVALAALAAGRAVVVVDDEDRENEGDIIFAAQHATSALMAFTIRYTSGVICVPLEAKRADALGLSPMVGINQDAKGTAFTITCDAAEGITTGISAADRALTTRLLADPATVPAQLSRPGHIFPLRAAAGGVLQRRGHTEAAVDLCRAAGLEPAGVIGEITKDDGEMMRLDDLRVFAAEHDLPLISIDDLARWRRVNDEIELTDPIKLPTAFGDFTARAATAEGNEHMVLSHEGPGGSAPSNLVRIHSECLTGDIFGSYRCDCGEQLHASMEQIAAEGGHVIYIRGHEGRGIGLANKLRAYALQESGMDTLDANLHLGFPADAREYFAVAAILKAMGLDAIRLLSNNPDKQEQLTNAGITVDELVGLRIAPREQNSAYLHTKQARFGHHLDLPDEQLSDSEADAYHGA